MSLLEEEFRQQVMAAVAERTAANGGVISRAELSALRLANGETRRVIDTGKGIWNPRDLAATLSIVSSPTGPYDDRHVEGGLFHYDYRAGSTEGDNAKLRRAFELGLPVILLQKIDNGIYVPVLPTYVVKDDITNRQFILALDESLRFLASRVAPSAAEKRYAERVVQARLHQPVFRGKVIRAYRATCAICSLRHPDLLDAAHIIGDGESGGEPIVTNGLSLCKIHHAAYDRNLLGISPEFTVHIDQDLLNEVDGPMLRHGLQEMHGRSLILPIRRNELPDRDRLSIRFDRFRSRAAG
jgi:putative restriction endonuclease